MLKYLSILALTGCAFSQTFPCKGSFLGSIQMKGLYGGKTSIYQVDITCMNKSALQSQPISGALINLAMPTINTIPAGVASVLLTKTYSNQLGQRLSRDVTIGLGAFGAFEGIAGAGILAAGPAGWVVAAVVGVVQYILPFFTNAEPTLNLSNQCDSFGGSGGMIVPAGGTFECTSYVTKPPKGTVQLPSVITFDLMAGWTPVPLPPAPPVKLTKPQIQEESQYEKHVDAILARIDEAIARQARENYKLEDKTTLIAKGK